MKTLFALITLFAGQLLAADSKGVRQLVVQIRDFDGKAVEGASISLPESEIKILRDGAVALGLPSSTIKTLVAPKVTDKLGFVLVYYYGGVSESGRRFECSFPSLLEVNVSQTKKVKVDFTKRGNLSIEPAEAVVPHVIVTVER